MTVTVSSRSQPRFEERVDVLRCAFDFERDRFVMASDALHPAERPFRPVSIGFSHGEGHVQFTDSDEAAAFADWLRTTDRFVTERLERLVD